jgi:hypothetical protein
MALLEAGERLVNRLKARCAMAGDNVFSTADLAGVKERSQVTPALHVVLHSYRPLSDDSGPTSRWLEIYLVVVVVKHARQAIGAEAIRGSAAPLIAEVIAALDGWRCAGCIGRVRAIDPPNPLITDSFGYFPLAFGVESVTEGCFDPID